MRRPSIPLAPFSARECDRFWRFVQPAGDCWHWAGNRSKGYGTFGLKRDGGWRTTKAHRVAYEILVGPIPDGLQLDHLCRVPHCVNPDHLEPVTNRENGLRGVSPAALHARATHCPRGHTYTPGNTRTKISKHGYTSRECRTCEALMQRERALTRRALGDHDCDQCSATFTELRFLRMHATKVHGVPGNNARALLALAASDLTVAELAVVIDRSIATASAVLSELMAAERGALVEYAGVKRPSPSGSPSRVHRPSDAGWRHVQAGVA